MAGHRFRLVILLAMPGLVAAIVVPYLTTAQDGTPLAASSEAAMLVEGEQIFTTICIACHQAGGIGLEGVYPALAGNAFVTGDDPSEVTRTVLNGRGGMPRFYGLLTDEQIAAVISYIRGGLAGNHAAPITPGSVDQQFQETVAELTVTPEAAASHGQHPAAAPTPRT